MNKSKMISKWISVGLIRPVANSMEKLNVEKHSLEKLNKRNGYLASYDKAIRFVFISFLKEGYNVNNKSVHGLFQKYLSDFLGFEVSAAKKIILSRHQLKYHEIIPSLEVQNNLEKAIEKLQNIRISDI
jgi:hypothetical protein